MFGRKAVSAPRPIGRSPLRGMHCAALAIVWPRTWIQSMPGGSHAPPACGEQWSLYLVAGKFCPVFSLKVWLWLLLPPLESRGERTFYGAFEGGFSAGYWGPSAVSRVFEQLGVILAIFIIHYPSLPVMIIHYPSWAFIIMHYRCSIIIIIIHHYHSWAFIIIH